MVRRKSWVAALAVACALGLVVVDQAEAKRGMSVGSRGTRTFQAPATTPTAPTPAAPIQRTTTPQTGPNATGPATAGATNPAAAARPAQQAARPSMFGSGLAGNLMRGLLIGGLLGLLLGSGFGGLAGMLGLLLQGALIALAIFLVLRLMRGARPTPAGAYGASGGGPGSGNVGGWPGGSGPQPAAAAARPAPAPASAPAPAAPSGRGRDEIGLAPADLDSFERLLGEIQTAFGREDQGTLKAHATQEVFSFLADELRENAEHNVRNTVTDVKLLQGDIAESWREGTRDYATVAMRYESRDTVVDRATGAYVSGDRDRPGESTEVWTFTRDKGGEWVLAAIQSS